MPSCLFTVVFFPYDGAAGKPANEPLHNKTDYTHVTIPDGELASIPRRGDGSSPASLSYSVTMVAHDAPRSSEADALARQSAHMNVFFPHIWNENSDIVAMYVACVHARCVASWG